MAKLCVYEAVVAVLNMHNIPSEVVLTGKGHTKVYFTLEGKRMLCTCSKTASDRRAEDNAKADVRRMLRHAGITVIRG